MVHLTSFYLVYLTNLMHLKYLLLMWIGYEGGTPDFYVPCKLVYLTHQRHLLLRWIGYGCRVGWWTVLHLTAAGGLISHTPQLPGEEREEEEKEKEEVEVK